MSDLPKLPKLRSEPKISDALGEAGSEIESRFQDAMWALGFEATPTVYYISPETLVKYFLEAEQIWPDNVDNANSEGDPTYPYKAIVNFIEDRGGNSASIDRMKSVMLQPDSVNEILKKINQIHNSSEKTNNILILKLETRNNENIFSVYELPLEGFTESQEYSYEIETSKIRPLKLIK